MSVTIREQLIDAKRKLYLALLLQDPTGLSDVEVDMLDVLARDKDIQAILDTAAAKGVKWPA